MLCLLMAEFPVLQTIDGHNISSKIDKFMYTLRWKSWMYVSYQPQWNYKNVNILQFCHLIQHLNG